MLANSVALLTFVLSLFGCKLSQTMVQLTVMFERAGIIFLPSSSSSSSSTSSFSFSSSSSSSYSDLALPYHFFPLSIIQTVQVAYGYCGTIIFNDKQTNRQTDRQTDQIRSDQVLHYDEQQTNLIFFLHSSYSTDTRFLSSIFFFFFFLHPSFLRVCYSRKITTTADLLRL